MTKPNAVQWNPPLKPAYDRPACNKYKATTRNGDNCCCITLLALVLGLFGSAAVVLLLQFGWGPNLHSYHDGDQVLVSELQLTGLLVLCDFSKTSYLSSIFCQAYAVSSGWDNRVTVYLTDGPAQIDREIQQTVIVKNPGLKAKDVFDYRAFYLLPGSLIEVGACMSIFNELPVVRAEVLFIKGGEYFSQWNDDPNCTRCVQHRVPIPPETLCEGLQETVARYVIQHPGTYYVIITRQQRSQDNVAIRAEVDLRVTKTMYETSQPKEKCLESTNCKVNLTYWSNNDIVVQFPFSELAYPGSVTYFTTDCHLRRTVWISIFGILPAVISSFLCCCFTYDRQVVRRRKLQVKKQATHEIFTIPEEEEPSVYDHDTARLCKA